MRTLTSISYCIYITLSSGRKPRTRGWWRKRIQHLAFAIAHQTQPAKCSLLQLCFNKIHPDISIVHHISPPWGNTTDAAASYYTQQVPQTRPGFLQKCRGSYNRSSASSKVNRSHRGP